MKKNIKVLMLVNFIPHYRVPIYNKLGEYYNLTIAHYGDINYELNPNIQQINLDLYEISGLKFFRQSVSKISSKFDVVISLSEIRVVPNMLLGLKKRNFALIYWGIGVSASYEKVFGKETKADKLRYFFAKKAEANVFYSDYPISKYLQNGFSKDELFVANNTIQVNERIEIKKEKNNFLFVGTLYKQKKIYDLLDAYKEYFGKDESPAKLQIIGNGDEYENIKLWIQEHNFTKNIELLGQINNQDELKTIYADAIACISPGQAGLTVLNSMAYGVPFITMKDAITGGEILNIDNNINGVTYDDRNDLASIMLKVKREKEYTHFLSKNAQSHYFENRTVEKMVQGFRDAIDFAYKKKNTK